uniref:Ectonucleoside triphosphate diphosphohydrolase 4 n=1 Tax=Aceria tosichella TaxID=561515 RepID=A0A6G1SGR1_9ACAR
MMSSFAMDKMRQNASWRSSSRRSSLLIALLHLLYLSECLHSGTCIRFRIPKSKSAPSLSELNSATAIGAAGFDEASELGTQDSTSGSSRRGPKEQTYGVIVDCGSSGTRAHIYQWDTELDWPKLLQHVQPMIDPESGEPVSKKFTPDLASFADRSPEELRDYVAKVADYIAEKVPKERHSFTVVYMMATAGMRLLEKEEQKFIMDEVREYVLENYNFSNVTTSVISGSDEGMYRWISVNSKAKRFLKPGTGKQTSTYGVIEMGGASVQVVYQLKEGLKQIVHWHLHDSDLEYIYDQQVVEPEMSRANNHAYLLHSTTFLGFGGDSAHQAYFDLLIRKHIEGGPLDKLAEISGQFMDRVREYLVCDDEPKFAPEPKEVPEVLVLDDPCSPRGYRSKEGEILKPKAIWYSTDRTIGFTADEEDEKRNDVFKVILEGTGNYRKCKQYVKELLHVAKSELLNCEPNEPCTMQLIGEPFVQFRLMNFDGIGDFYYTTRTMLQLDGAYNHARFTKMTKKLCETRHEKLRSKFASIDSNPNPKISARIHNECFRAVWVDTFLVDGLGMPKDYKGFNTIDEIKDEDPEWTLGAVLDKSLAIEKATPEGDEETSAAEKDGETELGVIGEKKPEGPELEHYFERMNPEAEPEAPNELNDEDPDGLNEEDLQDLDDLHDVL